MQIPPNSSTVKQRNYAMRSFSEGGSKKQIALDSGYSLNAATSVASKIENSRGYKNAMVDILRESDNIVLNIFSEFRSRGFQDFNNKDLVSALNAIGSAWSKFNGVAGEGEGEGSHNKLRTVILQQIQNQTVNAKQVEIPKPPVIDMDF